MQRLPTATAAALALLALAGTASGGPAPAPAQAPAPTAPPSTLPASQPPSDVPRIDFERYVLPNGLEVILHRDTSVPLVAVDVWYHVGSGDETPGKSGFAHLFEHMLFQGSRHVGRDRHFEILKNVGVSEVNGTTNTDRTNYFEVVPSHQIDTALWLESDRMGYLLPLLDQPSLDNQIDVVKNERRQRYDNVPYGKAMFALSAALYPEGHPYRYLTIGRHEDLESATLEDVTRFYKKWYVPANATLVVAGDFELADVKARIERWFGNFPTTRRPERVTHQAPAAKAGRTEVADDLARLRRLEYAWHSPRLNAVGDADLDVLASALAAPGTGRLYKILVLDKQLAQSVSAGQASRQQSSYFTLQVVAKSDADLAAIDGIVKAELARLRTTPISQKEVDREVVQIEASYVWQLESLMARAETLQRCNHYFGKPDCVADDLARYRAVTPASIHATVKSFLAADRTVEILTMPATPKATATPAARPPVTPSGAAPASQGAR
jgi:zinc protease